MWEARTADREARAIEEALVAQTIERRPAEFRGPVVSVSSDSAVVQTNIRGRARRVRVPVSERELRLATDALVEHRELIVEGELEVAPRSARMLGRPTVRRS